MDQRKIDTLANLLKRLNSGENPQGLKFEVQNFLATIDPNELLTAEQRLIDAGLPPEDLRNLCSAHMEMVSGELETMKKSLSEGHPVHTLVCEHDMILGFLDKLEDVNKRIQKLSAYDEKLEEFSLLKHIIEHLIGAEPHHMREEEVLFPELEDRGISGPPQVMRMEHTELRARKKEIKELSETVAKLDFNAFKKRLDTASKLIILTLRDHIFKENNILYPTALDVLQEIDLWDKIKEKCDKIGYCCFTPKR